mmetsp:Transcript_11332/g.29712  ORF Transcript_11332/g.29712 Transcript_11332/m.29712 type:complete len:327 (-) Transcript_11332:574-1554(-)
MPAAEPCLCDASARGRERGVQVVVLNLLPCLFQFFLSLSFPLLLIRFQLVGELPGLTNCLAAGSLPRPVLFNCDFNLLTDKSRVPGVKNILQLHSGAPDGIDRRLGHLLANGDPRVLVLLSDVLDPLVLKRQRGQVLGRAPTVLHQPIHLALLLLIRMCEGGVIKERRVQVCRPFRFFGCPPGCGPLFEQVQSGFAIFNTLLILAGPQTRKGSVGHDHRTPRVGIARLLIQTQCRIKGVFFSVRARSGISTVGCRVSLLFERKGGLCGFHAGQIFLHLVALIDEKAIFGVQRFLKILFCLVECAQPKVCSAHSDFNPGAHSLILGI